MSRRIYGLLGAKLGHSFSPAIHAALGNEAYTLYEKPEEELEAFVRREDLGGLNVTIPYKQKVLPFVDECSDTVRTLGAANTLYRRDGKLCAANTDVDGFCYMARSAGITVTGKKVLVLGNGGASQAVQEALRQMGAGQVLVFNRTPSDSALPFALLSSHEDADVLVNTTPVGMYPDNLSAPVDLRAFPNLTGVLDIVYNPLRTGLLLQAEALGIPFANGLSMLVAQAVRAHEYFFDTTVDDAVIGTILADLTRQVENLVLIGMPGCGKTTIARLLAERTGREVIDLDEEIVRTAGKSIPDIFAEDGEAAFRDLEHAEIEKAGARTGVILSLGGGAVTREDNYLPLHQNGRIYQLTRDPELLPTDGRPLSRDLETLKTMAAERAPLYERFRDVWIANDATPDDAADRIWNDFAKHP